MHPRHIQYLKTWSKQLGLRCVPPKADGTWFTTYAEHNYKLPPDLLYIVQC